MQNASQEKSYFISCLPHLHKSLQILIDFFRLIFCAKGVLQLVPAYRSNGKKMQNTEENSTSDGK